LSALDISAILKIFIRWCDGKETFVRRTLRSDRKILETILTTSF
jgi:hypothetical protein